MARDHTRDLTDPSAPVLHVPQGAVPRGLRSDAFLQRESSRPQPAPSPAEFESRIPALTAAAATVPAPRDWDFALPAPLPPKESDALHDPDANWRRQVGLRAPEEPVALPDTARERFAGNWERLASEPRKEHHSVFRRRIEKSRATRWLFTNGRFDFGAAAGPLLLLILLCAAIIYGRQVIASGGHKPAPPAETPPAPAR